MSRISSCSDMCDKCGNSDDCHLPFCEVCKQDICHECCYDFQENDEGDATWAICHDCSDEEQEEEE